jgi:aspartyl-tRNA(Asn)/glutamyl-tRNA(Gln) amidotransferase subunit C
MIMPLDLDDVKHIAALARIHIENAEATRLVGDLNDILAWIDQLNEVDISGVDPLAGAIDLALKLREDVITDGGYAEALLINAPERHDDFFVVPRVIEIKDDP